MRGIPGHYWRRQTNHSVKILLMEKINIYRGDRMSKYRYRTNLEWLIIIYLISTGIYIFDNSNPKMLIKIIATTTIIWTVQHSFIKFYKTIVIDKNYLILNYKTIFAEQIKEVKIKQVYVYDGNRGKLIREGVVSNTKCIYISMIISKQVKTVLFIPKQYKDEKKLLEDIVNFCNFHSIPINTTD